MWILESMNPLEDFNVAGLCRILSLLLVLVGATLKLTWFLSKTIHQGMSRFSMKSVRCNSQSLSLSHHLCEPYSSVNWAPVTPWIFSLFVLMLCLVELCALPTKLVTLIFSSHPPDMTLLASTVSAPCFSFTPFMILALRCLT